MHQHNEAQPFLYRNVQVMASLGVLILLSLTSLLLVMSWRNGQYLEPIRHELSAYVELERLYRQLSSDGSFVNRGGQASMEGESSAHEIVASLKQMQAGDAIEASDRTRYLLALIERIKRNEQADKARAEAQRLLSDILDEEMTIQLNYLNQLSQKNQREFQMAIAIAMILPLLFILLWFIFQRRVLYPLDSLTRVMELLARKEYRTIDTDNYEPFIRPVFDKYNRMVRRMQDLEEAHVKREGALRQELEQAASAMVQQQSVLARVDRLAALGDVAARMAHSLRNPLTGVLFTLTNLCEETGSSDHRDRLRRSIEALLRSFDELTHLVDEARQDPETPNDFTLGQVVDELFQLLRHQTDKEGLVLENRIPEDFTCQLPETAVRYALMKLVQNAMEAQREADNCVVLVSAEKLAHQLEITVEDAGPGFDAADLERIRSGFITWGGSGRGTGLSIVRRFCEQLGGRLQLNNLAHGGAKASMIIPLEESYG